MHCGAPSHDTTDSPVAADYLGYCILTYAILKRNNYRFVCQKGEQFPCGFQHIRGLCCKKNDILLLPQLRYPRHCRDSYPVVAIYSENMHPFGSELVGNLLVFTDYFYIIISRPGDKSRSYSPDGASPDNRYFAIFIIHITDSLRVIEWNR